MVAITFKRGGHPVSQNEFIEGLAQDALDKAVTSYAESLHAKAASVVDPETGKHATVFVRRIGKHGLSLHTSGSPAFARALEQRLGLDKGEVHSMNEPANRTRLVYLAHAWEDKDIAKPIAEGLLSRGIDVWYDQWEIRAGDSLRQKMEAGLGTCTHFLVLLTKTSIGKPWVNEEIDVGLMRRIEGTAKFMGLRYQLSLDALSPFLKTRLTPEFSPGEVGIEKLVGEIYGISQKPPIGEPPRYVRTQKSGSIWSQAAQVVAEYFVRRSEHAQPMDPQATYTDIQRETNLPMPDVRIGVLDLVDAGLLEKHDYIGGEAIIFPRQDLFVTFDADFMDWNPTDDAHEVAALLANQDDSGWADAAKVAGVLGWPPRRFNVAAAYLVSARVVRPVEAMGSEYSPCAFMIDDALLRFVRSM